jgi:hypothetical protein
VANGESATRLDLIGALAERTQRFFASAQAAAVLEQPARDEAVRLHLTVGNSRCHRVRAGAIGI